MRTLVLSLPMYKAGFSAVRDHRPFVRLGQIFLPIGVCLILITSCSSKSDEDQIRNRLGEIVSAVEDRDRRRVNAFLTADFVARSRGQQVDSNLLMLAYFRQVKNIRIITYGTEVVVTGNEAAVQLNAVVSGGQGWLPERLNVFNVNTVWLKDDDWLVQAAEWERVEFSEQDLPEQVRQLLGTDQ